MVGERKGPSVATALAFRRRAALQEMSASRIRLEQRETDEKRDDVGVAAETRWMDGGGWLVGEGRGFAEAILTMELLDNNAASLSDNRLAPLKSVYFGSNEGRGPVPSVQP